VAWFINPTALLTADGADIGSPERFGVLKSRYFVRSANIRSSGRSLAFMLEAMIADERSRA
jgi:hypothetical protein